MLAKVVGAGAIGVFVAPLLVAGAIDEVLNKVWPNHPFFRGRPSSGGGSGGYGGYGSSGS